MSDWHYTDNDPPFNPEPVDEDCAWTRNGITSTDEEAPSEATEDDLSPSDA